MNNKEPEGTSEEADIYAGWKVVSMDHESVLIDGPGGQRRRVWLPIPRDDRRTRQDLLDEIDHLRVDAERYRWLRDSAPLFSGAPILSATKSVLSIGEQDIYGSALDAAVDAARKGGDAE